MIHASEAAYDPVENKAGLSDDVPQRTFPPPAMTQKSLVCGVDRLPGKQVWQIFRACANEDLNSVDKLLVENPLLINAQYWYQLPIHFAVRSGNRDLVKRLLDHSNELGLGLHTYDSWPKLLQIAEEREFRSIRKLLQTTMAKRFRYSPDFVELRDAIQSRNRTRVRRLIAKHPQLARKSDAFGNNAVHWCVLTRQLDLMRELIEQGCPIHAPRADGQSPILLAINGATDYWYRETRSKSHPSLRNPWVVVGALLAMGARHCLSVAAAVGDLERVEALLKKAPSAANHLDSARISPLTYAAREGHLHIVAKLLEAGADPNQPEEDGPDGRALFEACWRNQYDVAEMLLSYGANPNAGLDSSGCCLTICEHAHGKRSKPLQELLRKYGAFLPPYMMSKKELKKAIQHGDPAVDHEEMLGSVIEKGDSELFELYRTVKPTFVQNLQHWNGLTYPNSSKLIKRLFEYGLDPNQRDWLGKSFLHICAAKHDVRNALVFIKAGADVNARDLEYQETPLATAIRIEVRHDPRAPEEIASDRYAMVKCLLRHGSSVSLNADKPWSSPKSLVRKRGFREIESLLDEHGAH